MIQIDPHALQPGLRVTLDGESVPLPKEVGPSIPAIRAYLEYLALSRRRVLHSFSVDGVEFHASDTPKIHEDAVQSVNAGTITFAELSERLIRTACHQIEHLRREMMDAVLRVLINEHDAIIRCWRDWLPQFRAPLVSLGFLRELWGEEMDAIAIGPRSLTGHIDSLHPILCEVDAILMPPDDVFEMEDAIALSGVIESRLIPWLRYLGEFFYLIGQRPVEHLE